MNSKKVGFILALTSLCLTAGTMAQKFDYIIKNQNITDKPVSPLLMGNFIEMGFGRSENLRAEMLYNRSFEEDNYELTDWVSFTRSKPELEDWWHSGYETQLWYLHKTAEDIGSKFDKNRTYWPSCHSKTNIYVSNKSKTEPVYFAQDGMYIRKGMGYKFSGYFNDANGFGAEKMSKRPVEVTVGLYAEKDFTKPIVEKQLLLNTVQYTKFELSIPATEYEGRATFAIKIPASKKIGLDLLSLMPNDNVKGWRKDVVEMIKKQVPSPIIRFPGGCYASFYNWRDGIGDEIHRPVDLTSFWNNPVMNDMGTIEFVEWCREIKAEPQFCAPLMFMPIENTLDWLSFCNAPIHPLRSKYGHPEPLNVKYWELENEMYRRYNAITYAEKCVEFAKAMKAIDPTIKLIMGDYWAFNKSLKQMLEIAGQYVDIINNRGGDLKEQAADIAIIRAYNQTHNRNIQLCHTEFRAPTERNLGAVDALNRPKSSEEEESLQNKCVRWSFAMSVVNQFIQFQNFGGDYAFLNFTSYNDTWGENLINVAKEKVFLSAVGRGVELMCKLDIAYPQLIENKDKDSEVVLQAAWSKDKKQFILLALNFGEKEKSSKFDLKALNTTFKKEQKQFMVFAESMKSFNSPQHTTAVKSEECWVKLPKGKFAVTLKPYSINAWVFDVAN